ncbi:hypothetical protein [Empedobacter falsenii]
MKKILLCVSILAVIYTSAQDIDIKKGKVLFDKKEVALVEGKKRVYTLSDLQNKPILSIEVKDNILPNGESIDYYTLTDLATNETNDVVARQSKFSFSLEKGTIRTFSEGDYRLLNENGFDKTLINKVITTNKKNYQEVYNTKKDSINKVLNEATTLVKKNNIIFNASNGTIVNQETYPAKKIIIGSLKQVDNKFYLKENELTVGIWENKRFTLENGNSYYIQGPLMSSAKVQIDEKFANHLIGFALLEGYGLENQLYYKKEEEKKQMMAENYLDYQNKVADAKSNSSNLYDVPGYLIDEKGNKVEGKLSINFEDISQNIQKSNVGSIPENYGKSVFVKALNEKGKEKSTRYKSNTGAKFCTDSGDCYIGLKTVGNVFNSIGNVMSLSTDFSYFYKILNEDNGFLILEEPSNNKLYIKIPNQEKALYLGNNNDDKLEKNFNEYIKCSLNATDFDLKSVDGIKIFFEKYKTTCK